MNHPAAVDVGTPHSEFAAESWSTTEVRYHGFAELPAVKGDGIRSPQFTCLGRHWCIVLYPAGNLTSDDGMVGLFIKNISQERVKIHLCFGIRNSNSKEMKHVHSTAIETPRSSVTTNEGGVGYANFVTRTTVVDSLVKGALVIDVKLKLVEPTSQLPCPFVAANPFCSSMLKLFMDEEFADTAFEVGGQGRQGSANNRAKKATDNQTFYAHRIILKNCASQLDEMCGPGGKNDPVPILDVKPEIFHHLLYYVYGGKVPEDDMKAHAKEIIDAADKYGVPNLKLEAEACYVHTTTITLDNVMDNLLYADSKNCALLKEVAMDFIIENKMEVLKKAPLKDFLADQTMMMDMLVAVARCDKKGENDDDGADQFSTMRIGDLRRKAHERGLNVNGSREALIASLENDS